MTVLGRRIATWEKELWDAVDMLNAGIPPDEALASDTRSELQVLRTTLTDVVDKLGERAEAVLRDDPEHLSWRRWADWAVRQGRERCDEFLAHPETAPRTAPYDVPFIDSIIADEYQRRYGTLR
jgi:hypothetical protein